jgi:hypothetical protein
MRLAEKLDWKELKGLSFYWGVRFYGEKSGREKFTVIYKRKKLEALTNEDRKVGTKMC